MTASARTPLHNPASGVVLGWVGAWERGLVRSLLWRWPMMTHTRVVALALLLLSLPTVALAFEPPPERGFFVQLHGHHLSDWTLQDYTDNPPHQVNLHDGAGVGVRAGYDFFRYVGVFASAEFNVELEGPYTGYGAGLVAYSPMLGWARLQARVGLRRLSPGPGIFFGTVGAGAELFLFRHLSLGLEWDTAVPLTDGTRWNGSRNVKIEADNGPYRVLGGLTWYFGS